MSKAKVHKHQSQYDFLCISSLVFISIFFYFNPLPASNAHTQATPPPITLSSALKDMGFADNITTEGQNSLMTFFFKTPQEDLKLISGALKFHYKVSPGLFSHSNVQFSINGQPRLLLMLGDKTDGWVKIPLTKMDFKRNFMEVSIKTNLLVSQDRCLNELVRGYYFSIDNDSGIEFKIAPDSIKSIRGFFNTLPNEVTVSLPSGKISPEIFEMALRLGASLHLAGKKPLFTRLPNMGHFIIAPLPEIKQPLDEIKPDMLSNKNSKIHDINLIRSNSGYSIHLNPSSPSATGLFSTLWIDLLGGTNYSAFIKHNNDPMQNSQAGISLKEMGFTDIDRWVGDSSEWKITLASGMLPPRHKPTLFNIDVITTPPIAEGPNLLHVYLNERLVRIIKLENSGESRRYPVGLPSYDLRHSNVLRLLLQRTEPNEDCKKGGVKPSFPAQILPSSYFELKEDSSQPEKFAQLDSHLKDGFDLFIPDLYLSRPEWILTLVSRIFFDFGLPPDAAQIVFYDNSRKIDINRPFLIIGRTDMKALRAPITFNERNIRIEDFRRRTIFNIDGLEGVVIAQLAQSRGHAGLWIAPGNESDEILPALFNLDEGDVAFLDRSGAIFFMNSSASEVAKITGQWGIINIIEQYRFLIFIAGVIIISISSLYLYRKFTKHKNETNTWRHK